jgi:Sulfotransferase domain
MATASTRTLPDFVVIGGIRCGTSSMYEYLDSHPDITFSARKELHYFDWNYDRGVSWYRSWFPTSLNPGIGLTGEATPSYLMNPSVPERAYKTIPDAKFLLLLRDPVDRAISHFNLRKQMGHEKSETLKDALEDEPNRLGAKRTSEGLGNDLDCYFHQGNYVEGLKRWLQLFDRESFCVISSEGLFEDPAATYAKVLDFFELEVGDYPDFAVHNAAAPFENDNETAAELTERYRASNEELYELVGVDFGW